MIVDALLGLLIGLFDGLLGLLPDWDISQFMIAPGGEAWEVQPTPFGDVVSEANPIFSLITIGRRLNWFVPFDHFVAAMTVLVFVFGAVITYKAIRYVVSVVRGSGT